MLPGTSEHRNVCSDDVCRPDAHREARHEGLKKLEIQRALGAYARTRWSRSLALLDRKGKRKGGSKDKSRVLSTMQNRLFMPLASIHHA